MEKEHVRKIYKSGLYIADIGDYADHQVILAAWIWGLKPRRVHPRAEAS
jgi:hypothetical protein